MLFVETRIFTRLLPDYLSDEEYKDFQAHLAANPEAGDIMQRTGGLRKVRWKSKGKGKRAGVSVARIYLLTLYAKNEVSDLSPEECKALMKLVKEWNL